MGNVPGLDARKVKETQEELYIADAALEGGQSSGGSQARAQRQSSQTSKLFAYPSSVTGRYHTPDSSSNPPYLVSIDTLPNSTAFTRKVASVTINRVISALLGLLCADEEVPGPVGPAKQNA